MNQDSQDLNALIERIGESYFRERFNIQIEHASKIFSQGRRMFHIENVEWLMAFVYYNLQFTGLYDRGVSILNNAHCPREVVYDPWHYNEMQGYTSAGTGSILRRTL